MDRTAVATPHSERVYLAEEIASEIEAYLSTANWLPIVEDSVIAHRNTVAAVGTTRFNSPASLTITVTATLYVPPCDTPEGK